MTDSRTTAGENQRNILVYLKSLQLLSSNVDIEVKNDFRIGLLQVRQGKVCAAECGKLFGNGALLTLAAIQGGKYQSVESDQPVTRNVSLTLQLAERLLNNLPGVAQGVNDGTEEEKLQQAVHLFYQFRRKEAGIKLVEILRGNRFFYPAWLWHSRLMTREDYIKKALNEAKKWGNSDQDIRLEAEKIESQLDGSTSMVKRCFFCWSVVKETEASCSHCHGMFRIAGQKAPAGEKTEALTKALAAYERELESSPGNAKIAYCLCLGFYSQGNDERAKEFISRALKISPHEPLFARVSSLLGAGRKEVVQATPPVRPTARQVPAGETVGKSSRKKILVVEDSQTARKVITMLLERNGYLIVEARNGSEALTKIEETLPDLVLLDLMLPDMSGYEVLSRIRQSGRSSEIPVIMLTGKSNPADRMKGLYHGSNEYLTKPFDPAKLLAVLEKYLDQPEQEKSQHEAEVPAVAARVIAPAPQIQLPAAVEPIATRAEAAAPLVPEGDQSGKSILVIEDSPTSRKVISMVIAKRGYRIDEAATGSVAMRKVQERTPNLILLDAMLPDMTGYDILHRFKNDKLLKDIPVVMLTAKNNPVDRQKGLQGGSVAYLTKPFDPEKLLAVIDEYI